MNLRKHVELLLIAVVVLSTTIMIAVRIGVRVHKHYLERQLSAAMSRDDAAAVMALLDRGVRPRRVPRQPNTLVAISCSAGAKHTLVALLRRGERPGANDIAIPALRNDPEMVDILMKAGASPNAIIFGRYPIMISLAEHRQFNMMKRLIDYGANPNVVTFTTGARPFGSTPLMIAVLLKDITTVRTLLNSGARVDARVNDARADLNGYTALMIAEQNNAIDEALLLLEYGAKTDTVAADGATPVALAKKNDAMLRLIQKYSGADKNKVEASL